VRINDGTVSIGSRTFAVGDTLTIDGSSGEVFAGAVSSGATIVPEAATLLSWARELGIEIGAPGDGDTTELESRRVTIEVGSTTVDRVIRALLIKGFATPDDIAPALFTTPEDAGSIFDRMTADGLAELTGGMFTLTADGKNVGAGMIAADRERWGADRAQEALDGFLPLDRRMKDIVTAWQMRDVDGRQVLNDHSDPDYDASVLDDLGSLHREAEAWLSGPVEQLPRLDAYRARLERAARLAGEGDHLYIASPRVDSYHTIWFELHEDLIQLTGRTREEEAAAGRA
jgi:pyruvate,orthophosphate dikinase